jgi:hypothetical protein
MDRSFLSQPEVIAAARKFVCIRLTSYEDETEKKFVSKIVNGEPANTAFAMLTPDGERALRGRGPGRGPRDLFKDAADMAKGMDELARKYPPAKTERVPALPVTLNAKVGLAVAAGDLQPLVVVLADSAKRRDELEAKVAELAWDKEFAGRLTYATAAAAKEIPHVDKLTIKEGILLIEPDIFGAGGKVVKEVRSDELGQPLAEAMRETLKSHVRTEKNRWTLAEQGLKQGIYYETGIPVSGKGEAADRERYRKQLEAKKKPD